MASKLLTKAKHSFVIRSSGLFDHLHNLEDAILICVSNDVYILFNRLNSSYYFIEILDNSYDILSIYSTIDRIDSKRLVRIAKELQKKEIHGASSKERAKSQGTQA
jgi:hypothetical protein